VQVVALPGRLDAGEWSTLRINPAVPVASRMRTVSPGARCALQTSGIQDERAGLTMAAATASSTVPGMG